MISAAQNKAILSSSKLPGVYKKDNVKSLQR